MRGTEIEYIDPRKPNQNACVETLSSKFRDQYLHEEVFFGQENDKNKLKKWRVHYNEVRPHAVIRFKNPKKYEGEQEYNNLALCG